MNWFRTNSRFGTVPALLAVALQLVLSFGHCHPGFAFPSKTPALSSSYSSSYVGPDSSRLSSHQDAFAGATLSDSHPHAGDETDSAPCICGICTVMALAGAAVHCVAPFLRTPDAVAFSYGAESGRDNVHDFRRAAFQPRGPPAV